MRILVVNVFVWGLFSFQNRHFLMPLHLVRRVQCAALRFISAMGQSLPVTPEGIDALLEVWPVFEAFQTQYVAKGLILDAEKNVSAPSPTGPSAGATATARPARGRVRTVPHN